MEEQIDGPYEKGAMRHISSFKPSSNKTSHPKTLGCLGVSIPFGAGCVHMGYSQVCVRWSDLACQHSKTHCVDMHNHYSTYSCCL